MIIDIFIFALRVTLFIMVLILMIEFAYIFYIMYKSGSFITGVSACIDKFYELCEKMRKKD